MRSRRRSTGKPEKTINLALQGGGAHGAFTWGVLDALLEDGRIGFEAVSGTSAGAMNAVALADGLAEGGNAGARRQLSRFWKKASLDGRLPRAARTTVNVFLDAWKSTGTWWLESLRNSSAPYGFTPLSINPLRAILDSEIDFERLRKQSPLHLSITATDVETGKIKVFATEELTSEHVLASAALPLVFEAVEIGGRHYWDGGYMGNPALYPLYTNSKSSDVLLIQINPIERKGVPKTAAAIQDRINEITFNATLLREFRTAEFVGRLVDDGRLPPTKYKHIRIHRIAMSDTLRDLQADSKMHASWDFFCMLRDAGREAGKAFLASHYADVGVRGTLDLHAELD